MATDLGMGYSWGLEYEPVTPDVPVIVTADEGPVPDVELPDAGPVVRTGPSAAELDRRIGRVMRGQCRE